MLCYQKRNCWNFSSDCLMLTKPKKACFRLFPLFAAILWLHNILMSPYYDLVKSLPFPLKCIFIKLQFHLHYKILTDQKAEKCSS